MTTPNEHKAAVMAQLQAQPFAAPDWLKSKHRQSSFASMHRKTAPMPLQRERWTTPDDDFLDLYFHETAPGAPLVLLLHGLEDNAETAYVRGFMQAIAAAGWNPVLLEFRSCGGELNHAPRLYHMGETTDLDFVIRRLAVQYPHTPIHLLGFSLGANVLLKWLGEQRANLPANLRSAAALSAPFDPTIGAANIHRQLGGLYMKAFLNSLIPKALAKEAQFPGSLDVEAVRACKHFWDFDTHVTARLHGFEDADDYWRKVGCHQFLRDIRLPTLLLSASDDPFNPAETLPREVAEESPWLHPLFPEEGGHLGFVYGDSPENAKYWAEEQVLRFFGAYA
jgi:predicted alpha/beta-fold hydrolase